jgi:hypothetical protein
VATLKMQSYFLAGPRPVESVTTRGTPQPEPQLVAVATYFASVVEAACTVPAQAASITAAAANVDARLKALFRRRSICRFWQVRSPRNSGVRATGCSELLAGPSHCPARVSKCRANSFA